VLPSRPSSTPHPPPAPNLPPTAWIHEFWRLVRHRFWLKFIGVSGFMALFFQGYFYLLRHPVHEVMTMPLTALDAWVGFQPWAFWPYVSLWIYVGIPAGLMADVRSLVRYGGWAALLSLAGLACFYLVPTGVPAGSTPASAAEHVGFALLRGVDAPGNACPSLHVATALFSAAWIHRLLRVMQASAWALGLNALWAALIVFSTMAIKQHVAWDVVGGIVLALPFALLSLRMSGPRRTHPGR
jgi:membrane-associated phospholipid phosphatase